MQRTKEEHGKSGRGSLEEYDLGIWDHLEAISRMGCQTDLFGKPFGYSTQVESLTS